MKFSTLAKIREILVKDMKQEERFLQMAREKKERELADKDSDWNTDEGKEELRKNINRHMDRVIELEDLIREIDEAELR